MKRWPFILFVIFSLCAFCAEWITNDKPIVFVHKGKLYFPCYKTYTEKDFGGVGYKPIFDWPKEGSLINPLLPYSSYTIDLKKSAPYPPCKDHFLGTDDHGRDVFARLLYGARISLLFGFLLAILGTMIGVIFGAIQGYFGGVTDLLVGRVIEIWASIPSLFLILIFATPNFITLLLIMLFFNWLSLSNTVRAEFFRVRTLDYVVAAQILGLSPFRIMMRHILPNAIIGIKSYFPFMVSFGLVQLASLNFLGFGLPFGMPSLGDLLSQAKDNIDAPWIGMSVFCAIAFILGLLILISEELKEIKGC